MASLKLVSFNACPFVQRAAIMLEEQDRAYDIEYIDLFNKPDWFLAISPNGKVPVLDVEGTPLFESAVILEYLDETTTGQRLLPEDALERARQRMWITYISAIMAKGWQLQAATEEEKARALVGELRDHFAELAKQLPEEGPMWGGTGFTMVDVAIAPILQRFTWAEKLEPSLGLLDGMPAIAAWRDAVLARPSVTASILPDLETISGTMLHGLGSWVARDVEASS